MIGKEITYDDFEGNTLTEKFWFHLSKAELLDLEMRTGEGFEAYGKKLIAAEDKRELVALFKEIILMSFGVRDPNNAKRFIKSEQLSKEFSETNAFVELYVSLFEADNMVEFFKGVIPQKELEKALAREAASGPVKQTVSLPKEPEVVPAPKFERTVAKDPYEVELATKFVAGKLIHRLSTYDQNEMLNLSSEEFATAKELEEQYRKVSHILG